MARRIEGGEPPEQIADEMGIAIQEVQRISASQEFRTYYENYRNRIYKDVDQRNLDKYKYLYNIELKISNNAEAVMDKVIDLALNATNELTALKACMFVLTLANIERLSHNQSVNPLSPESVQNLAIVINEVKSARNAKAKIMSGKVVDVNP